MFWGLILQANKRYSQTVTKTFHLSQAALDVASCEEEDVQVWLASEKNNYLLCTLQKNKIIQVPLDLMFSEGDDVGFSCVGGTVHLTGFLTPEVDYRLEDEDADSSEISDKEITAKPEKAKKLKKEEKMHVKKEEKMHVKKEEKMHVKKEAEESDEDEDDSDIDLNGLGEVDSDLEEEEDDSEDENDSDEESEDDDDDENEEMEEEITEPVAKIAKLDKATTKNKQNKQNGLENGKPAKKNEKKEKENQGNEQQINKHQKSPKEKVLQGGVKIEDIRLGKGAEAKPGKKVQVYYEGRLKSNNKIFDSSKSGEGFKFVLGRGEVIRGWDIGVVGMKIGSKRRIVCPPNMAYGAKGSPPVIPSNSTLVFDVELRGVN